jgi:uncharacterized protein
MYTSIYTNEEPVLLEQLANTPGMQRLADIGMHCGCEYAKFPIYQDARIPYTRLTHSVGVAKIVWNFTHDIKQAIAGLLHDIATPVFAHTIDFLHNDHLAQESTEDNTLFLIESSKEITTLLKEHHIYISDISDYHIYPIADNDPPMLSADRLEYTLGNGFCVHNMELSHLHDLYEDLIVVQNEHGIEELCFQSLHAAKQFTELSLRNSRFFVSDEDRFSMQHLADIVRCAVETGVLMPSDLYLSESEVICKLNSDGKLSQMWREYTNICAVATSAKKPEDRYCVNVSAKKRYIDPLVLLGKQARRLTDIDIGVHEQINAFLNLDLNKWIYAV